MAIQRARSAAEYIDWIQQARFEVAALRDCFEYELEDLKGFPVFIAPLQNAIDELYSDMAAGRYTFGREDLPFMELVSRFGDVIPFHLLLKQINETHRYGLEVTDA